MLNVMRSRTRRTSQVQKGRPNPASNLKLLVRKTSAKSLGFTSSVSELPDKTSFFVRFTSAQLKNDKGNKKSKQFEYQLFIELITQHNFNIVTIFHRFYQNNFLGALNVNLQ